MSIIIIVPNTIAKKKITTIASNRFLLCLLMFSPLTMNALYEDLITIIQEDQMTGDTKFEPCCDEDHLLTCDKIDIHPSMLMQGRDLTILGISFTFSNNIEPNGLVYKTEAGDEAVITYREVTGNMWGSVKTRDGRSFAIEKCKGGQVLKEYDVDSFPDEEDLGKEESK